LQSLFYVSPDKAIDAINLLTFSILIQLASVNVTSVPWNYVTGRRKFTNVKVDTINGYSQYISVKNDM